MGYSLQDSHLPVHPCVLCCRSNNLGFHLVEFNGRSDYGPFIIDSVYIPAMCVLFILFSTLFITGDAVQRKCMEL